MNHGTSISNLIKLLKKNPEQLYVTDTPQHATRYANAQATGVVSKDYAEQAEGTAILTISSVDEPVFSRRDEAHNSLDVCEAIVENWKIDQAVIRFCQYENTVYGNRFTGYYHAQDVVDALEEAGIEIIVL